MRLAFAALLTLVSVGCRYQERDVACDPVVAGCGGGETCTANDSGAVTCACGESSSSTRACAAGTSCSAGACVGNSAPTAVISNASNGVLRAASNTTVSLSARDSSDPEGSALTYLWSFTGNCGASPATLDLTTRDITINTSGIADDCNVTLTVFDALGEPGSTSAMLALHAVGGRVSNTASTCVATYNPDAEDPQGTDDAPFCDLAQAVLAATDNAVAEVSAVAGEKLVLSATLDLSGVQLIGGYTVTNGVWTRGGSASIVSAGSDFPGPVVLASGGAVRMEAVTVQRGLVCATDCILVEVNDAQLTLKTTAVESTSGGSAAVTGVYVHGDDATTQLTLTNASVALSTAPRLYGIDVDGPGKVTIDSASTILIAQASTLGIGLRVANHADVTVANGSINVAGAGSLGTIYGILDGRNNALDATTPCPAAASCKASDRMSLSAVQVNVHDAFTAYGAAFFGSKDVTIASASTVTVFDAPHVEGLATMDVSNSFVVNDTNVTATGIGTALLDFAFAYQDGYIDTSSTASVVSNGSKGLSMNAGTHLTAIISGAATVESYAAMLLASTQSGVFTGTVFAANATAATAIVAGAVTIYGTKNVTFDSTQLTISGVTAQKRITAFADGCSSPAADDPTCNTETLGSTNLTLKGNLFAGALHATSAVTAPRRACVLLGGTKQSSVTQNALNCTPEIASAANEIVTWLWAFKTDTVDVTANTITSLTHGANGAKRTYYIGILDGLYPVTGQSNALVDANDSKALTLNRNQILINEADANATVTGVWYRGQADTDHFTNNTVDIHSALSYGLILDRSKTVVGLNSIRASCLHGETYAPCPGSGTAIYILLGAGRGSQIVGNLLTTEPYTASDTGTFVIDQHAGGAAGGIELFTYNQYALSGDHAADGPEPDPYGFVDNSSDRPQSPIGASTTSSETVIQNASPGATVTNNVRSTPVVCGTLTDVGAADSGVDHVPLSAAADAIYQKDVNNSSRSTSVGYDCGAAERSISCVF